MAPFLKVCCAVCNPVVFIPRARPLTQGIRTGIFIPLLLTACHIQWRRRVKRRSVNKVMVFTTVFYGLMIILVCSICCFFAHVPLTGGFQHWVISLIHFLHGIAFLPPGEDMEMYFQNFANPLVVCKVTLLQVEIIIADWVMVSITNLVRGTG